MIISDHDIINSDERHELINYVAHVLETKAGLSFAPWSVGGVFPFFRPKWVSSFELAENWSYDSALLAGWVTIGPGCVLLDAEKGQALWHQFQAWSREAQGGVLQKMESSDQFFCFRPDRSRSDRVKFIVTARPRIQAVTPRVVTPREIEYAAR